MPKNVFAEHKDYVKENPRTVDDLSFANNLTLKFGALTPVFFKECAPGDSLKIEPRVGLQFMPMAFPVQTPIRAYLHFFKVRHRNLWKDFMDFYGDTKEGLVPPYLNPADSRDWKEMLGVGSLLDYLGVPNVHYDDYGIQFDLNFDQEQIHPYIIDIPDEIEHALVIRTTPIRNILYHSTYFPVSGNPYQDLDYSDDLSERLMESNYMDLHQTVTSSTQLNYATSSRFIRGITFNKTNNNQYYNKDVTFKTLNVQTHQPQYLRHAILIHWSSYLSNSSNVPLGYHDFELDGYTDNVTFNVKEIFPTFDIESHMCILYFVPVYNTYEVSGDLPAENIDAGQQRYFYSMYGESGDISERPYNPYFTNDNSVPVRPLSALPCRAYEAVYNAYYRNMENNPFIVNGVAEYNKYIPTNEGGRDMTKYVLHYRNWEFDHLTSAVQSPQQGVAPLVGITMTGTATFEDNDGNQYYAQAEIGDDGEITGWKSWSQDLPQGTLRMLVDSVGTGISINDLRNVNALQRWLENNIRVGLKFKDQIKAHFGVEPKYNELDMPEFLGGMAVDVNMLQLNQQSNDSSSTPMGSFVGLASARGESNHEITCYCDEPSFVIGILSVVPRPVYSQLLPTYFTRDNHLSYFFPEFNHIGYQPILQEHVSPVQTYYDALERGLDPKKQLLQVFGYQRPWWDYISSTDEVHGEFRTTFRNFLMNRTFSSMPVLNKDFLLVDPAQLNDVFLVGDGSEPVYGSESDKIVGSCFFKVSKKTQVSKFGIPSLT